MRFWKKKFDEAVIATTPRDVLAVGSDTTPTSAEPSKRKKSPSCVYRVRVREGFEGELVEIQSEMQLERRKNGIKSGKVTYRELMELMLDTFKVARRNGMAASRAVPIPNEVWDGLELLASRQGKSVAAMFEELVVDKVAQLELLPRK